MSSDFCNLPDYDQPSSITDPDDPTYTWYRTTDPVTGQLRDLTGISYLRSRVRMADITDGASYTYLAAEKYLDPDHYDTEEDSGDTSNDGIYAGWDNGLTRYTIDRPYEDTHNLYTGCLFGSAHNSIFHAAMCDGSVTQDQLLHRVSGPQSMGNRCDGQRIDAKAF